MDKNSSNVNKKTLKTVNKMYEQLTMLECIRREMRYFNYDGNDEIIDDNIFKMKELLDNMYELSIQKKCGWTVFKPQNIEQPDTPVPNTPENKSRPSVTTPPDAPRKNILNEILDYDSDDSGSNASDNSGSDMSIVSDVSLDVMSCESVTDTSDDDYIDINDEETTSEEEEEEESSCCEETSDEETSDYEETDVGDTSSEEVSVMSDDSDEEYSDAESNYCPYCAGEV
mgnify:CR=1 FL=1